MNEQNIAVWILAGGGIILAMLCAIVGTYTDFKKQKTKEARKRYCLLVSIYASTVAIHLWIIFTSNIEVSMLCSVIFILVSIYFIRAFGKLDRKRVDPDGAGQPSLRA